MKVKKLKAVYMFIQNTFDFNLKLTLVDFRLLYSTFKNLFGKSLSVFTAIITFVLRRTITSFKTRLPVIHFNQSPTIHFNPPIVSELLD